jgi:hypothetical protein
MAPATVSYLFSHTAIAVPRGPRRPRFPSPRAPSWSPSEPSHAPRERLWLAETAAGHHYSLLAPKPLPYSHSARRSPKGPRGRAPHQEGHHHGARSSPTPRPANGFISGKDGLGGTIMESHCAPTDPEDHIVELESWGHSDFPLGTVTSSSAFRRLRGPNVGQQALKTKASALQSQSQEVLDNRMLTVRRRRL